MITREQVKQVLILLDEEYGDVFPKDNDNAKLKIDTWHKILEKHTWEQVQAAVMKLMSRKVYGKPKVGDIMEILKPVPVHENLGAEFADSMMDLLRRYGTEYMGEHVHRIWGDIGLKIFLSVRSEMRYLLTDDVGTFKAQLRNLFNSKKERADHGRLIIGLDEAPKLPQIESSNVTIVSGERSPSTIKMIHDVMDRLRREL